MTQTRIFRCVDGLCIPQIKFANDWVSLNHSLVLVHDHTVAWASCRRCKYEAEKILEWYLNRKKDIAGMNCD
jgi:hypothetical protein